MSALGRKQPDEMASFRPKTLFLIYALWQNDLITLMLKPVAAHLKFWLISSEQF